MQVREEDALSRIPALKTWFRTSRAVVCCKFLTLHDFYLHFCIDTFTCKMCPYYILELLLILYC